MHRADGGPSEVPRDSWPGAAEHQQVIGDDAEPDPALHPALAAVPAPPEPMTALKRTDPAFAPRAPAEGCAGNARALLARLPRQHDVPDPAVLRGAFIGPRGKAAIATASCGARSKSAMCRSRAGPQRARSDCPRSPTA